MYFIKIIKKNSKIVELTGKISAVFTGDGGTSQGDFHEALNLASVWKLPVIFAIENNGYGLSTPTSEQYAIEDLADRGILTPMVGVWSPNLILFVIAAYLMLHTLREQPPLRFEFNFFKRFKKKKDDSSESN